MSEIKVKSCPLLGCSYPTEPSIFRGYPHVISAHLIPCVGDECINFIWDGDDGFCRYFNKYTNHNKRPKEGEGDDGNGRLSGTS